MPYDPRMLQMAQMGVGMLGQPPSPYDRNSPQRPKEWWEQPMPSARMGQPADPSKPDDPNDPYAPKKKPQAQPSLLQMLMLGGPATYSGTPRPGPQQSNPWGWLGGLGGGRS